MDRDVALRYGFVFSFAAAVVPLYVLRLLVASERLRTSPLPLLTAGAIYTVVIGLSVFVLCAIPEALFAKARLPFLLRYSVRAITALLVCLWVHRSLYYLDGDETYHSFSHYLESLWLSSPSQALVPLIFPATFFLLLAAAAAGRARARARPN